MYIDSLCLTINYINAIHEYERGQLSNRRELGGEFCCVEVSCLLTKIAS